MEAIELSDKLTQAEVCFSRYEWDEAIACFDAILQAEPHNRAAQDGRRKAQVKKEVDAQIQADIANAQVALKGSNFGKTLTLLDQAQTRGADNAILKYHAEIDRLREALQERQGWQARIKETLGQAARLRDDKAVGEALRVLNALLRDLAAAGLDDMGEALRSERDRLQAAKNFEDQKEDVNRARKEQDFRYASELVTKLREQYPNDAEIQKLHTAVSHAWSDIQLMLRDAETAMNGDRLDDAVGHLRELQRYYPNNPDWKGLWLRAHMDHGRALVDTGRQLVPDHAFDDARVAFEMAQSSFQAALEIFPDHPSAGPSRDEVRALQQVAAQASQAAREMRQGAWEPARGALDAARQKLAEAVGVRRREFSETAAVLNALWGQVNDAVEAVRTARGLLAEGESLLTARDLGKAEERFSRGLAFAEGRDEASKESLVVRLGQARRAREEVEKQRAEAEGAEGAPRIALLEQAYAGWPAAPGLSASLVDALLREALRAQAAGDGNAAARCCERVLSLPDATPASRERAQQIQETLQAADQIRAALGAADRALRELESQGLPPAAGYGELADTLLRARSAARRAPEFSEAVESRLATAQTRQERLAAAEPLLARAAQEQKAGQWGEAAAILAEAVKMLEGVPAPEPAKRLPRWQKIALGIEQGLKAAGEAYGEANSQYLAGRADLAAVKWDVFTRTLGAAQRALAAKPAGADPLPPAWEVLAGQVGDLQTRGNVLRKVWELDQGGKAREALPELAKAVEVRPDDPVLGPILARLQAKTAAEREAEAARWLTEAGEDAARGDLTGATEKLSKAREQSESAAVLGELRRVERQVALWQRFQELDLDGTAKHNNYQPIPAKEAFAAALRLALDADSGLADEVRDILGRLLSLGTQLHRDDVDREARELQYALQQAARQNRLIANYLMSTVTRWYDLSSRQAREGLVVSRLELNMLEDGYRAAAEFVGTYPQDQRARELYAKGRQRLLSSLLQSARKRLGRAEELRDMGIYVQAQAALAEIKTDLFGPVEKKFPEVIEGDEDVADIRRQASNLGLALQALQDAGIKLEPLVQHIREAYAENRISDARAAIAAARAADPEREVVLLWKEINALQQSMDEREQEQGRAQAQAALDGAEVALRFSQTAEAARRVIADLETNRALFSQLTGAEGAALRQRWLELTGRAHGQWEEFQQVGYALRVAEEATSLEDRLDALGRAAASARGSERERILAQMDALSREVQQQQQMAESWSTALEALEIGDYELAMRRLVEAKRLGKPEADVVPYLQLARAGQRMRQAQLLGRDDPDTARRSLEQVLVHVDLALIKNSTLAYEFRSQVAALEREFDRRIAEAEADRKQSNQVLLARLLIETESAYRQGQFDVAQARLDEIFAQDPEQYEAVELQTRVDRARQALTLLDQARTLRESERYERALGMVNEALRLHPDLIEAELLQAELSVEIAVSQHISRARDLVKEDRYGDAYAELKSARQKTPNQRGLAEAVENVRRQEDLYWEKLLRPVEDLQRRKEYRAVVEHYSRILVYVGPDLQAEICQKQQSTINQWADVVKAQAQAFIEDGKPLADLLTLRDLLREVAALTPPPSGRRIIVLRDLARQIDEERLRIRLREGDRALSAGNYDLALGISEEVVAEAADLELPIILREADRLEAQVAEAKREREQHLRRDQAFIQGKAALVSRDFDTAAKHLAEAQFLGLEIEGYLRAAQAGQFLVVATEKLKIGDLIASEQALQQALRVGEHHPPAFEIMHDVHRMLTEVAFSKVSALVEAAQKNAAQLYLSKAESLTEQAYGIVKQLYDDNSMIMSNPMKMGLIAQVTRLQEDIPMARDLWRTVTEAQSYLRQEDSAEAFRLLSNVLNRCSEENEITHEIRQRVIWLLEGKRLLKDEYEALERLLLQRIAYKRNDQDAWAHLRWVRAQRKFDEDWNAAQTRSRATLSTITKQIDVHRAEIMHDLQIWKWLSVLAAVATIGFLGYALVFLFQWREPLTYLTTLPALLTGIAAPFVHDFYKQMVSEVNKQTAQAIEQLKAYEGEENERRKAMFNAVLADAQTPGGHGDADDRVADSPAET